MRFTNLNQSLNLVASALCEADKIRANTGVRVMDSREEVSLSPPMEKLELTLELSERDDSLIPLPPVVNVTICVAERETDQGSSTSLGANSHIRNSCWMAENRFRDASTIWVEDSLGWASSAFSIGARTPSKSAKHKIDTPKSSKSKMRKTVGEPSDLQSRFSEIMASPMFFTRPNYHSVMRIDFPSYGVTDIGLDGIDLRSLLDMDEVSLNSQIVDVVQHEFDPWFTSGLDDYSSFHEFTDVG